MRFTKREFSLVLRFCSIKYRGVLLLPAELDSSLLTYRVTSMICCTKPPLIHLGEEKQSGTKFLVKTVTVGYEPGESSPSQHCYFTQPDILSLIIFTLIFSAFHCNLKIRHLLHLVSKEIIETY